MDTEEEINGTPDSKPTNGSPSVTFESITPHFPDEPRGRVVIGKKATHLSRIREHHSW